MHFLIRKRAGWVYLAKPHRRIICTTELSIMSGSSSAIIFISFSACCNYWDHSYHHRDLTLWQITSWDRKSLKAMVRPIANAPFVYGIAPAAGVLKCARLYFCARLTERVWVSLCVLSCQSVLSNVQMQAVNTVWQVQTYGNVFIHSH